MEQNTFHLDYGAFSHSGTVRDINEDNFVVKKAKDKNGKELLLVVVADGMGGYQAGELASETVVVRVGQWWDLNINRILNEFHPFETVENELIQLLTKINEQLIVYGNQEKKRLGTTATLLFLYEGYYLIVHVGDSRIYQITKSDLNKNFLTEELYTQEVKAAVLQGNKKIRQLTHDHSWVEEQVKLGSLTQKEAATHEKRHILLQCLGIENGISPFVMQGTYENSDIFLLCSDGFYNLFTDAEILSFFLETDESDLNTISKSLVKEALKAGATDNVTVLLTEIVPNESTGWTARIREFMRKII